MKILSAFLALGGVLLFASALHAGQPDPVHGNDVVHIGNSINVGPNETVGDAVCVGCSIHVAGRAGGDLVAVGGSVQVDGMVRGEAVVVGGNLRLGPNAVIHGDATVVGGKVERDPSARIEGEITNPMTIGSVGGLATLLIAPLVVALLVGVVVSVLCLAILGERRIETIVLALRQQTGLALLAGLGVVAGFLVLVTVFHWTGPLAPLVFIALSLAMVALAILGYTGVSAWVGHGIAPSAGPMGAVVAGALLVGVLQAIPVLGLMAVTIFALFALGGAAMSGLGSDPRWLAERISNRPAAPRASTAGH